MESMTIEGKADMASARRGLGVRGQGFIMGVRTRFPSLHIYTAYDIHYNIRTDLVPYIRLMS